MSTRIGRRKPCDRCGVPLVLIERGRKGTTWTHPSMKAAMLCAGPGFSQEAWLSANQKAIEMGLVVGEGR